MSIKIGINGTASFKNVVDVIVGTSTTAKKDINFVKDWNGTIIWQRKAPDVPMNQENTVITINPASYNESGSSASWGPYEPSVTKVTVNGVEIGTDKYQIEGYSNNSGTGTVSGQKGRVTISGKNGYSGSVYKEFSISYTQNIEMTQENTTITINPTSYNETGLITTWGPYNPNVTSVKVGSITLASNQYDITGYSDSSGRIWGYHQKGTIATSTGKVTISGKNGCTGSAYKEYPISYKYDPYIVGLAIFEKEYGTTAYAQKKSTKGPTLSSPSVQCMLNNCKTLNGLYLEDSGGYKFLTADESIYETIKSARIALSYVGNYLLYVDGFSLTNLTSPTITGNEITSETGATYLNLYLTYQTIG